MALFKFVKAAVEGKAIDVFNNGDMARDFTYIDDIIIGIIRVIDKPASGNKLWAGGASSSSAPYKVYNIGNNNPVKLMDFIEAIEQKVGAKIKKNMMEMQQGDIPQTYASVEDLVRDMDYKPSTSITYGISKFVDWYLDFYDEE
jgi:UDP-glucuronate 4-epimerase